MRRRYLEDWIFYWIALAVKGFFEIFPYSVGVCLGAGVIYLCSFFYQRRYDVAYLNLKSAFPEKNPAQIKWLIRKSVLNLSLSLMEFILSSKLKREDLKRLVDIKGSEHLRAAITKERGIIFLTGHYNNWELLPLIGATLGQPSYVIAREQKYKRLNRLLNRNRNRWGCVVVGKGISLKKIYRALKAGKSIGILADQNAGKNGIQVKLFNRYASTNPGFIEIARSTGAVVLPIFLSRRGLLKHQLDIYPEFNLNKADAEILTQYNNILEYYIRRNPEQWLWFHKKWKHSANRYILILSDSKPGHYKQAEVVAEELKVLLDEKLKQEWQLGDENLVRISKEDIIYRSRYRKKALYLCGIFSSKRCQGCLKCLKWALTPESYKRIVFSKYDYIISAGSSSTAINAILSRENRACSINILNPGIYKEKFNLVFTPNHDLLKGANISSYNGALVKRDSGKAVSFLKRNAVIFDEEALKVAILIGGSSKSSAISSDGIKKLLAHVDSLAEKKKINLSLTTSRRTQKEIEALIKNKLALKPYLKILILASELNPEGAYDAILDSADIIVVTADSISMISEALSREKRVYVFKTGKIAAKNERFLNLLLGEKILDIITPGELCAGFNFDAAPKKAKIDNRLTIRRELKKII